jgi:hypothetical protein
VQDAIAAEPQASGKTPYQRLLRSIGAYLDNQAASQVYVLETDDGFVVRYIVAQRPFDLTSVYLRMDDVVAIDLRYQGRRAEGDTADEARPGRYQDLLRAIGYELEHADARHVVLDEVDGTFTLTYHYGASTRAVLHKHRTTITPAEAEELFRRARARRRAPAHRGWLRRATSNSQSEVRLVRLANAEAGLERSPNVLYEYTLPTLKDRTAEVLRTTRDESSEVYKAGRFATRGPASLADRLLKPFEAAQLISTIYSRCLDPVRFPVNDREPVRKDQVVAVFARCLTSRNVLGALELVARNIDGLRSLDTYQPGLGTTTVRWMQHLAAEAQEGVGSGASGILPEGVRLHQALSAIQGSVNGADRLAAMRRSQGIR